MGGKKGTAGDGGKLWKEWDKEGRQRGGKGGMGVSGVVKKRRDKGMGKGRGRKEWAVSSKCDNLNIHCTENVLADDKMDMTHDSCTIGLRLNGRGIDHRSMEAPLDADNGVIPAAK